jgi:hypothetical protein
MNTRTAFLTFRPTAEQRAAAEACFLAMAHEQAIRPIVEAYERDILTRGQWRPAAMFFEQGASAAPITEPRDAWTMDEADHAVYVAECHTARDAAGLAVDAPDKCPLLMAEWQRTKAETALLEAIAATPGLESLQPGPWMTVDLHAQAVDLALRLMARFVRDAGAILGDLRRAA